MQTERRSPESVQDRVEMGTEFWREADLVKTYDRTDLRPVEAVILDRYQGALRGRVLEIGVGAGRVTRHLCGLAAELHGIDISAAMVRRASDACPAATIVVRDLRDLGAYGDGSFDAVVASFNVLDILDHEDRERELDAIRRLLSPGGTLIFSSHNRAFAPNVHGPVGQLLADLGGRRWRRVAAGILRLPRRLMNHSRMRQLERSEATYAIVNDSAHEFALTHYYIDRDEQQRQLERHGFRLAECLDMAGGLVPPGSTAATTSELHYVATLG